MKKTILILSVFVILIGNIACLKDEGCQNKTLQSEAGPIAAYAAANSITGTTHSSGLYYQVITPGSGPTPNANSTISVKYTGKLLSGTVFDQQTTTAVTFPLAGTISGWQIGLPLIQKGGKIKLIVPSSLAYGCAGYATIPGNAVLFFEIELVDVM